MKTINNKSVVKLSIITLFIAFVAVSCKPEPPTPPSKDDCELQGKFTRGLCLPSIFNNFVIIENGTNEYLVPCESDVPAPQHIKDGDNVEFSYEEIPFKDSKCEAMINCDAIPDKPYRFVRITCLKTKNSSVQ